uniref:Uncharacterized protein n=1 Tax=Amphimedon queenslandica TaxID=400682 RepID=A0A1X7T7A9_AMPQE
MATANLEQVEVIENEKYSLLSVPEASSALVRKERENYAGNLNLEKFVNAMDHVGKFIEVAYNGANAAGPEFVNLQIEIQRLGFDITDLCNESSVAIEKFRAAAAKASSRLISIYQFLLDGHEKIAIKSLNSLGKIADEMAKIAHELEGKFKRQADKVQATQETTKKAEADKAIEKEGIEKECETVQQEKEDYETLVDKYYKLAEEAREERKKYEKMEEQELKNKGNVLVKCFSLAVSVVPWAGDAVSRMNEQDSKELIEKGKRLREIVEAKNKTEQEVEKLYWENLQKRSEFTAKLQDLKDKWKLTKVAQEALHEVVQALCQLALIMKEAAKFWAYIKDHCKQMATTEIMETIEDYTSTTTDKEERKALWNSPGFVTLGVSYHAGWISLRDVCENYRRKLEVLRSGLYGFIADNPTYEQSLERLPELSKEFTDLIEQGKKSIEDKRKKKEQQKTE